MNAADTSHPSVCVESTAGRLFRDTSGAGICFVPEVCLQTAVDGGLVLNEVRYLLAGWARRNGRLNFRLSSHRLFPDIAAAITDLDHPEVIRFLRLAGRLEVPVISTERAG